jgi:predicted Zn-dependent protease
MLSSRRTIPLTIAYLLINCSTSLAGDLTSTKARISSIGERVANGTGIEARIMVVDEKRPDAYVYPDKTIVITTGLAQLARSDDEIAFVIGHELAHITKEHCREEGILSILSNPSLADWERREIEADINGINYARKAGYEPSSSEKLLSRMLHYTDVGTGAFTERINAISIYLTNLRSDE